MKRCIWSSMAMAVVSFLFVGSDAPAQSKEFADAKLAFTLPWDADWVTTAPVWNRQSW